ncbi:hypothetical protein CBM2599_B51015 [Cupriavidus taiwanensis]|nr:hypothetical protein CBM2599_B51015 [Cupriavidus taiwanensis]SOY99987.1 hypothetical protein CBM2600_B70025 [Cupriavidus taiwanensis]
MGPHRQRRGRAAAAGRQQRGAGAEYRRRRGAAVAGNPGSQPGAARARAGADPAGAAVAAGRCARDRALCLGAAGTGARARRGEAGLMRPAQMPAFEFNEETTHGSTQQDRRGDWRGYRHRPRAGTGLCAGWRARRGRG